MLAATVTSTSATDLFSKDSAFFSVFVCEVVQAMLANPNKPIDLIFCTVPQKYFTFVVLAFAHFVLPYAWVDIASVILVGASLHLLRGKRILIPAVTAVERMTKCGACCNTGTFGYIMAANGVKNAKESSDNLVAFDRR